MTFGRTMEEFLLSLAGVVYRDGVYVLDGEEISLADALNIGRDRLNLKDPEHDSTS